MKFEVCIQLRTVVLLAYSIGIWKLRTIFSPPLLLRLSYTVTVPTAWAATPRVILCCKANWTISLGEAHFVTFELTTVPTHQKTPRVRTLAKHALIICQKLCPWAQRPRQLLCSFSVAPLAESVQISEPGSSTHSRGRAGGRTAGYSSQSLTIPNRTISSLPLNESPWVFWIENE